MTTNDLGPLSILRLYASGGAAESEGPAADQNDRGIAEGGFGDRTGGGVSGRESQAVIDRMASPSTTGSRGPFSGLADYANSFMEKDKALGTIASGFVGGPLGLMAGPAINALEGAALSNAQRDLTPAQLQDLLSTGTPQIDARGHSHGVGPGGTNNNPDNRGASASETEGGAPTTTPTPSTAAPTPSTRYIPGTGDYEQIMIRHDGVRTDLQGRPLAYAAGGAVPGAGEEGPPSGLFAGGTPGRADLVDAELPENSYVIPADIVSGLGDGNSEAGALSLAHYFTQSPLVKHDTVTGGPVRARVSAGEFYVSPADQKRAGGPDALDKMVKELRKHYSKHLAKLPGPKK